MAVLERNPLWTGTKPYFDESTTSSSTTPTRPSRLWRGELDYAPQLPVGSSSGLKDKPPAHARLIVNIAAFWWSACRAKRRVQGHQGAQSVQLAIDVDRSWKAPSSACREGDRHHRAGILAP